MIEDIECLCTELEAQGVAQRNLTMHGYIQLSCIERPRIVTWQVSLDAVCRDLEGIEVEGSTSGVAVAAKIKRLPGNQVRLILQIHSCRWIEYLIPDNIHRRSASHLNTGIDSPLFCEEFRQRTSAHRRGPIGYCRLEVMPDVKIRACTVKVVDSKIA